MLSESANVKRRIEKSISRKSDIKYHISDIWYFFISQKTEEIIEESYMGNQIFINESDSFS